MTPVGVKTCREFEFETFSKRKTLPWFKEGLCIEAKSRKIASKIAFLQLFASIHRLSLNQGTIFSLRKCQIEYLSELNFWKNSKFSKSVYFRTLSSKNQCRQRRQLLFTQRCFGDFRRYRTTHVQSHMAKEFHEYCKNGRLIFFDHVDQRTPIAISSVFC